MDGEEEILLAILGRGGTLVYLDIGPLNDDERAKVEARLAAVQAERLASRTTPYDDRPRRVVRSLLVFVVNP